MGEARAVFKGSQRDFRGDGGSCWAGLGGVTQGVSMKDKAKSVFTAGSPCRLPFRTEEGNREARYKKEEISLANGEGSK